MDSELLATVDRLQSAVILVMDPQTPSGIRREASDVSRLGNCLQCGSGAPADRQRKIRRNLMLMFRANPNRTWT